MKIWIVSVCITVIILVIVGVLFATGTFSKSDEVLTESTETTIPVATGGHSTEPPPALTGTSAIQLGAMGIDPWGSMSKFVDPSAQWIWNLQTAAVDAPNTPVKFSNQWYNTSSTNVPATLHILVDNKATVMLNGEKIADVEGGWSQPDYPKVNLSLIPGNNVIDVIATNTGGPAALIASLVASGETIILRTDSTWVTNSI